MDEEELTDDVEELEDTSLVDEDTDEIEEETLPTLTYRVENGRITSMVDEREAMVQAVDKILKTDRFTYPIYDEDYGNDLSELFGKTFSYAKVEVKRMIAEALMADDRINSVVIDGIEKVDTNTLAVSGSVDTIYGTLGVESEVAIESESN